MQKATVKLNINCSSKSLHSKKKKKKKLRLNEGIFFFLLLHLNDIRVTGVVHDELDLAFRNNPSVTTRVIDRGIISK